jgi:flagellar basal-body rod modification protein FlgD
MVNATQNSNSAALFSAINASSSASANAASAASTTSSQTTFLKLLVTQMQNQDPMNPVDNAQMTSQMAQLNTVNGINQLNTTLQALSSSVTANQSLQAASLIGHGVLTPGNTLDMANGVAIGGMNLSQSASNVQVLIRDQAGNTVRTLQLGAMSPGAQAWQWDGKSDAGATVPSGSYSFTVAAKQGGSNVSATALEYGLVHGVTPGSSGANLNVGLNGTVAMSQVQQIL